VNKLDEELIETLTAQNVFLDLIDSCLFLIYDLLKQTGDEFPLEDTLQFVLNFFIEINE
jgi:hypothetical protein